MSSCLHIGLVAVTAAIPHSLPCDRHGERGGGEYFDGYFGAPTWTAMRQNPAHKIVSVGYAWVAPC